MLADLTSGEGHTDAGILCLTVALGSVLALRLRQEQGEHGVSIQDPHLSDLCAFIAGVVVAGVASDLVVDQVCFLILPGRLNADPVVSGRDASTDGGLVLYRGSVCFVGIRSTVGVGNGVPQQAGKVNLPAAGIGHRITSVQGVCCFVERSEGVQVLLLGVGQGGSGHRVGC